MPEDTSDRSQKNKELSDRIEQAQQNLARHQKMLAEQQQAAADAESRALKAGGSGGDSKGDKWREGIEKRTADLEGSSSKSPGKSQKRRVILIMTVEIGDGRMDTIKVHEDDNPQDLAITFCREHDLSVNVVEPLSAHIKKNLKSLPKTPKKQATGSSSTPRSVAKSTPRPSTAKSPSAKDAKPMSEDRIAYFRQLAKPRPKSAPQQKMGEPQVNPNSTRIAKRSGRRGKVFKRLHEHAKMKQKNQEELKEVAKSREEESIHSSKVGMSWVSKELMKGRTAGRYDNYGQRLHAEGMLMKEQKEAVCRKAKEEEEREDPEATFKPNISDLARKIKRPGDEPWQRIVDSMGEQRKHNMDRRAKEAESEELRQCTFKPSINDKSDKLMKSKEEHLRFHRISHHEQLFLDAERRRIRQDEYNNWFPEDHTFHPDIGVNKHRPPLDPDHESFIDRLVNSKRMSEQALRELREKAYQDRDPVTGQEFFKPLVGRSPNFQRNSATLPIGDFLYASRFEFNDIKERLQDRELQHIEEMANMPYARENSLRILEDMKRKRYREIFDSLDEDEDGYIDPLDIELEQLPREIADDLQSILQSNAQKRLSFVEFCYLLDQKIKEAKTGPRTYLRARKNARRRSEVKSPSAKEEEECTFKPNVDRRSKLLAAQRRKPGEPLHEVLTQEGVLWEERRKKLNEQYVANEMQGCTFTPKIKEVPRSPTSDSDDASKLERATLRLSEPYSPREPRLTSTEIELIEHCTFQPQTTTPKKDNRRSRGSPGQRRHQEEDLLDVDSDSDESLDSVSSLSEESKRQAEAKLVASKEAREGSGDRPKSPFPDSDESLFSDSDED